MGREVCGEVCKGVGVYDLGSPDAGWIYRALCRGGLATPEDCRLWRVCEGRVGLRRAIPTRASGSNKPPIRLDSSEPDVLEGKVWRLEGWYAIELRYDGCSGRGPF